MSRIPDPYTIYPRSDSETFRFSLNHTSGLPHHICNGWKLKSFKRLPDELARHRYPKNEGEAKAGAQALINYLMRKLQVTDSLSVLHAVKVKDFAKDMFTPEAPHLKRWAEKGHILKPPTVTQHRRFLVNYILPRFGEYTFDKIRPTAIDDYLLEQKISNSCRNSIVYTFKLIMREAKKAGLLEIIPEFEPFKRNGKRQDVLSSEELTALFPPDEKELINVWKRPDDMRKERDEWGLMFGTLFCVAVSAGLRSGEVRALHNEQISIQHSGLVIDRALDDLGQLGPLKKATEEETRSRAVLIPEITLKILERWLNRNPEVPDFPGMIFSYRKKPVTGYYVLDRFKFGLDRMGIDHENRRLTVHCLRYTYNTRMRTLLSAQVLREFMGHKSVKMTDQYDNPILLERLAAHQKEKPSVEQFWAIEEKNQNNPLLPAPLSASVQ